MGAPSCIPIDKSLLIIGHGSSLGPHYRLLDWVLYICSIRTPFLALREWLGDTGDPCVCKTFTSYSWLTLECPQEKLLLSRIVIFSGKEMNRSSCSATNLSFAKVYPQHFIYVHLKFYSLPFDLSHFGNQTWQLESPSYRWVSHSNILKPPFIRDFPLPCLTTGGFHEAFCICILCLPKLAYSSNQTWLETPSFDTWFSHSRWIFSDQMKKNRGLELLCYTILISPCPTQSYSKH